MEHLWYDDIATGDVLCQHCGEKRTAKNAESECIPFDLTPAPDLSEEG